MRKRTRWEGAERAKGERARVQRMRERHEAPTVRKCEEKGRGAFPAFRHVRRKSSATSPPVVW
jgi:hypothetical protein